MFDLYFQYREDTEVPMLFHRWSLIGSVGALLGRQFWMPFGTSKIFPNHYIMLIGNPGTRKSTAVKQSKNVLSGCGYDMFAADKTTKEKFLLDLEGETVEGPKANGSSLVFQNLFGTGNDTSGAIPKETFIVADEFNEFVGSGNIEFLSLLGSLWDWDDPNAFFKFRLKNSKSVHIFQPTISILSGNTHNGFQQAFPPETIGQGFLSRLLLVYSEPSGKKITFPKVPPEKLHQALMEYLKKIKETVTGAATTTATAKHALDMIYRTWLDLEDQRFKHYSTRRFTHLLKLSLVCAATRLSKMVDTQDVLLASSILSYTESFMPKALGEFGKSRNSEAANKLMAALYETKKALKLSDLWKVVSSDLEKIQDLASLLSNLQQAEKIQATKEGFLPKQKPLDRKMLYVDYNLLKEYKEKMK